MALTTTRHLRAHRAVETTVSPSLREDAAVIRCASVQTPAEHPCGRFEPPREPARQSRLTQTTVADSAPVALVPHMPGKLADRFELRPGGFAGNSQAVSSGAPGSPTSTPVVCSSRAGDVLPAIAAAARCRAAQSNRPFGYRGFEWLARSQKQKSRPQGAALMLSKVGMCSLRSPLLRAVALRSRTGHSDTEGSNGSLGAKNKKAAHKGRLLCCRRSGCAPFGRRCCALSRCAVEPPF